LAEWATRFGVVAGITTRGDDLNLGLMTSAPASYVVGNWRRLAAAMRPAFPSLVGGLQVHGSTIVHHEAPSEGWTIRDGVDGHATTERGILLLVSVADCVPIYLCAPRSGAVALLHAGWRGTAGGMVEAGIAAIQDTGSDVAEIVMHCGVAICGNCYEVGPEVLSAVTGREASGSGHLDLRAEIAGRALAAGVREVSVSPWCAAHDAAMFYSHRRSHGRDGRMLAYVGRPGAVTSGEAGASASWGPAPGEGGRRWIA